MKFKRLLTLVLATFVLASCGGNSISSSSTSSNSGSSTNISSTISSNSSESTTSSSTTTNSTSSSISSSSSNSSSSKPSSSSSFIDETNYYSGFNFNLTGVDMRKQVYELMNRTHKVKTSYDELKQAIPQIEAVPGKANTIYIFYTHEEYYYGSGNSMSFSGKVNREHAWPNSRGAGKSGPGSDPYVIKPTWSADNSSRGNKAYSDPNEGGWAPEMDEYKGDSARVIFYAAAHYGPESGYNLKLADNTSFDNHTMGKLSTLLKWNIEHPVNDWELIRNDNGQKYLGNRNPFVDHPELACQIWGDTNEATRNVCSTAQPSEPVEATGINANDITLEVESEKNTSVTVTPSNAKDKTVVYSGYDNSIISITDGKVKGLQVGNTTVTVSLANNESIKTTFKVTVTEKAAVPEPPVGDGTLTIDLKSIGATEESLQTNVTANINGFNFKANDIKAVKENIYFKAETGYIYNDSSLGNISKIELIYGTGGSKSAKQSVVIGSSVYDTKPSEYTQVISSSAAGNTGEVLAPEGSNNGFFRIDVSNKNLQVSSIVIHYSNM